MNRQRHTWQTRLATMICAVAAASILGSCMSGTVGEPGTSCQSTRQYFLTEVWGPVMGRTCVGCHAPGGQAQLAGARFQLLNASYPDFADANLASASAMANILHRVDGRDIPALLAKPLNLVPHGGGVQIHEGSPEYNALNGLIARVRANAAGDDACRDYGSLAAPSGVVMLDWRETLRKASLDNLGRLPTEAEYTAASNGEQAFETTLSAMIEAPEFYQRWRTAWNDVMLTNTYLSNDGCNQRALNLISGDDFPGRGTYGGGGTGGCCDGSDANREHRASQECIDERAQMLSANNAIASEPVNLFEHIIRNNRPFSEILTADYVLVNSASARIYGVESQYTGTYGADALEQARITYTRQYANDMHETSEFPHAGVLTTPAFLARYPTTETNRNRHRARIVQSYFLATDILKVGERPIDPTAVEALVQTPTMNYGPCSTCHHINDPIAGAFRGFFPNGSTWRYDPRDPWYTDMFPPGIAGENMPGSEYRSGLRWLAPRVTSDPRFVSSVVRFVFHAVTNREPLSFPLDTADANYAARAAAWTEQDRIFRAIGRRFVATNMNFKTVLIELIKSPLYRATSIVLPANLSAEETATRSAAHSGIGTGQLLSPEQLDAKIRAIAGFGWLRDGTNGIMRDYASMGANNQGLLVHEYYYPYGGINSDTIVRRVTDPSGIIIGVAQRMANEVACIGTAFDFTRPQADRRFFTRVQLDTVPEAGGNPVPANAALIRENIVAMHRLILGETLRVDDPEVDRTFTLFLETWRETRVPAMNMNNLGCDATINPITGVALEMSERITEDTNGTIRAWMAVLSYLFQDYKFLYQ